MSPSPPISPKNAFEQRLFRGSGSVQRFNQVRANKLPAKTPRLFPSPEFDGSAILPIDSRPRIMRETRAYLFLEGLTRLLFPRFLSYFQLLDLVRPRAKSLV